LNLNDSPPAIPGAGEISKSAQLTPFLAAIGIAIKMALTQVNGLFEWCATVGTGAVLSRN
jgi:hypothetical protein